MTCDQMIEIASAAIAALAMLFTAWAAHAALRSAKAAERALVPSRAYVALDEIHLNPLTGRIEFYTRNFGRTEAQDVTILTRAQVRQHDLNPDGATPHQNGLMIPDFRKLGIVDIKGEPKRDLQAAIDMGDVEERLCQLEVKLSYTDIFGDLVETSDLYETYFGWREGDVFPLQLMSGHSSHSRKPAGA